MAFSNASIDSRDPAVGLVGVAPQHDRVHDREDAGLAEIGLLLRPVVGNEPLDTMLAAEEDVRRHSAEITASTSPLTSMSPSVLSGTLVSL